MKESSSSEASSDCALVEQEAEEEDSSQEEESGDDAEDEEERQGSPKSFSGTGLKTLSTTKCSIESRMALSLYAADYEFMRASEMSSASQALTKILRRPKIKSLSCLLLAHSYNAFQLQLYHPSIMSTTDTII